MVIILDTPFSLGDLSPETFPHVYIINLMINGPAQAVVVTAEVGKMGQNSVWVSAPANTQFQLNMGGEQLYPFFFRIPENLEESLWDQVEALIYQEIQKAVPRYAGSLGSGLEETEPQSVPESVPESPKPETAETAEVAPNAST